DYGHYALSTSICTANSLSVGYFPFSKRTPCCVEIRPPCRAPVPCGNPPTLPGAGAVWKSAHLAGRRCRVEIHPPCRAPVPCGNSPIFMTKICQMTGSCVLIYVRRDFAYQLLRTEIFLNHR
ncbi:hypothetical protein, partial [Escherichia coli]|uniref:hypothetical protein n=1 Tax=Escherichia coli TaxID=562 RepID=UPI0019801397